MKHVFLLLLSLLAVACAAPPQQAAPTADAPTIYRVVLLYDTWGDGWPGFDQLIARLDGVNWVREVEYTVFFVQCDRPQDALTRALETLAENNNATLQSVQLDSRENCPK